MAPCFQVTEQGWHPTWFCFPSVKCIPKILVTTSVRPKRVVLLFLLITSNTLPRRGCTLAKPSVHSSSCGVWGTSVLFVAQRAMEASWSEPVPKARSPVQNKSAARHRLSAVNEMVPSYTWDTNGGNSEIGGRVSYLGAIETAKKRKVPHLLSLNIQ